MDEGTLTDGERLSAGELQRRAISGSTWTALSTFVGVPVAFAANAIVARSLGVASYGNLAFLTATLGISVVLANFGFSTALIQRGSRAEAGGRRGEADDLLRRSLGFHILVELPLLVVVVLALTRHEPWWEVGALLAAVSLTCALGGAALSITIENRTAAAARLAMLVNLAVQGASAAAALATSAAPAVWAVRTVVPAALLVFNLLLLDRGRRRIVLSPRLPRSLGRLFWRYALLTWVSGLIGILVFSRSEIFVLEVFHKTHALGLFALAFGLSQVMTAPADAMLHALLPAVAGILHAWPDRALAAFERGTRVSALVCGALAAVAVPTIVFAVPMIYGHGFTTAAWLFVPLALVSCFQSVNNPVTAFVNARERGSLLLKTNVVALLFDLALAVALIPPYGAWGAVAANVVGQLVSLVWLALTEPLALTRGLGAFARLQQAFLLGILAGGAALGVGVALRGSAPLATAGAFVVGGAAYVLAVRLARAGITVDDRDALAGAIAARIRPYLVRLLKPVTIPVAA